MEWTQLWSRCVADFEILQLEYEFKNLLELLKKHEVKTLLEIGTYGAGSTFGFLETVDWVASMDPMYNNNIKVLQREYPEKFIFIHGYSTDKRIESYVEKLCPQVDCLFIDADHAEASVRYDFENYKKFVKPGGLIGFHDIVETKPPFEAKVYYLWKELREQYKNWEFCCPENQYPNCGIGVIQVPNEE
jgi:predicted O-methyltransferase YrrM